MNANKLIAAIEAKALSSDSVRCLAYLLTMRSGVRKDSDVLAAAIGEGLEKGKLSQTDAEWLMERAKEIDLSVWDEVESFKGNKMKTALQLLDEAEQQAVGELNYPLAAKIRDVIDSAPVHGIVMRRFAVFGGACYYAAGGFHDYVGSFDTLDDAERIAAATHQSHPNIDRKEDDYEWWHIFDMTERRIVKRSVCQGYGAPDNDPQLDA